MDTFYGGGAGYRGKHATLTHDRVAQVGIRGGKFGTHDASIAAQVEQGAGLLTVKLCQWGVKRWPYYETGLMRASAMDAYEHLWTYDQLNA